MMRFDGLRVEASANYEIRVQGILDPSWSDRMSGLYITTKHFADRGLPVTILRGRLLDQADLFGILATLHNLRLPLLTVMHVIEGQ